MRLKIMKYIQKIVAGCIGLCLFACTETDELKTTAGKTGFVVSLIDGSVGVESRKTPAELNVPKTEFTIKVWKAGSDELVASAPCTGETGQVIEVGTGVYDVTAEAGENPLIALDAPYYKGITEDQRVDADKTTNVSIACKVANSLVSVKYDEENLKFSDIYQDGYYVRVVAGGDSEDIKNVENSVYFRAGSAFEVYFCGMKIGETEEKQVKLDVGRTTLQAGDHLILTLSPEPDKYDLPLSITKVEVKQETINATIPMEWLPKPKVTAIGFDTSNTLTFVETEQKQAALNLDLSSALQDIKFKFNFEDEQFASLDKETEYLLSTDKETIEQTLGITLPSVGDKPESIDLKGLIAKLQTNAGVPTNNSIEIDVQANNRWSSDAIEGESTPNLTYTLTCNKPVFTVDAYPGNIWTKEFTVNALREEQVTSGDFTKLSSDMTYQYSADGQTGWTNLSDGMRQDQLQPGTTYYIRGLYRGEVAGEVVAVSTYPETPLEYGNMEEWNTITKKLCVGTNIFNWRDVYGNSPNNNIWACVNAKTFEGDPNVDSTFNLNPSTYSVEGRSGKAAALRTVGWDNNWGNTSSLIRHIAAGKLFIGKYSFVHEDGPETYDYGMSYSSRPTSVEFYYTYSPYNGDSFKAWVVLENRSNDGNVTRIGYGELTGSESITSFTHNTISIEYSNIYLDITHMYIVFSSSANCSDVEETENNNLQGMVSEGNYHNGSVLTIDDVQLIYEK